MSAIITPRPLDLNHEQFVRAFVFLMFFRIFQVSLEYATSRSQWYRPIPLTIHRKHIHHRTKRVQRDAPNAPHKRKANRPLAIVRLSNQ